MNQKNLSRILSLIGSIKQKVSYKGISSTCPLGHRHQDGFDSNPSFFSYYSEARNNMETSFCYCHACGFKGTLSDVVTELQFEIKRDLSKILHEIFLAEWTEQITDVLDIPLFDDVPNHIRFDKNKSNIIKSKKRIECSYFVLSSGEEIPLLVNGEEYPVTAFDIEKMCEQWIHNSCVYFRERGLSEADMKDWGLGYANFIRYKKFKNNQWYYSSFLNRAVFSIKDKDGKLVGWSARRIQDSDTYKYSEINGMKSVETFGGPKYLHAQGFNKTMTLYGVHRANLDYDYAILCEGFFDAIKISKAGYENAFALMGGDLSDYQKKYLVNNYKRVIFFGDGDKAGVDISNKAKIKLSDEIKFVAVDAVKEGYYKEKGGRDPGDMSADEIKSILEKYL